MIVDVTVGGDADPAMTFSEAEAGAAMEVPEVAMDLFHWFALPFSAAVTSGATTQLQSAPKHVAKL